MVGQWFLMVVNHCSVGWTSTHETSSFIDLSQGTDGDTHPDPLCGPMGVNPQANDPKMPTVIDCVTKRSPFTSGY